MKANELHELYTAGQIHISEVSFFDDKTAQRLANWINRNISRGQASKRGNHVIVGSLPKAVMQKAYLAIGAVPEHEWTK